MQSLKPLRNGKFSTRTRATRVDVFVLNGRIVTNRWQNLVHLHYPNVRKAGLIIKAGKFNPVAYSMLMYVVQQSCLMVHSHIIWLNCFVNVVHDYFERFRGLVGGD